MAHQLVMDNAESISAGTSSPRLVDDARGHQYRRPLATMRAYLDGMGKAAVNAPALAEPPLTVLAALGPWMTALGGQRIACVHPYNVTPQQTAAARAIKGPKKWLRVEQKVAGDDELSQHWKRLAFSNEDLAGRAANVFPDAMGGMGNRNVNSPTYSSPLWTLAPTTSPSNRFIRRVSLFRTTMR